MYPDVARTKPEPLIVIVPPGVHAVIEDGETESTTGRGDSMPRAAASRILGLVTVPPLRPSSVGFPGSVREARTSFTVASGFAWRRTAHAPATCGVAMDVPLKLAKPPPGTEDRMLTPGANRSRSGETFENEATWSSSSTAPTAMAALMQAGKLIADLLDEFPDATTGAMRGAFTLLMTSEMSGTSASQDVDDRPEPRLMLTEAISC